MTRPRPSEPTVEAELAELDALRAAARALVVDLHGRDLSYATRCKVDALARALDGER